MYVCTCTCTCTHMCVCRHMRRSEEAFIAFCLILLSGAVFLLNLKTFIFDKASWAVGSCNPPVHSPVTGLQIPVTMPGFVMNAGNLD